MARKVTETLGVMVLNRIDELHTLMDLPEGFYCRECRTRYPCATQKLYDRYRHLGAIESQLDGPKDWKELENARVPR
jgi:hypothetical protein